MELGSIIAFGATAGPLVLAPGSGFVLFVATMTAKGRRQAALLVLGMLTGMCVLSSVILLVYPILLGNSRALTSAVAGIGGCYLVALGVRSLAGLRRTSTAPVPGDGDIAAVDARAHKATLIEGALSSLTNPGVLMIYLVIAPTFIARSDPWRFKFAVLVAVHLLITVVWYAVLWAALGAIRQFVAGARAQVIMGSSAALVLIGLGVMSISRAFAP